MFFPQELHQLLFERYILPDNPYTFKILMDIRAVSKAHRVAIHGYKSYWHPIAIQITGIGERDARLLDPLQMVIIPAFRAQAVPIRRRRYERWESLKRALYIFSLEPEGDYMGRRSVLLELADLSRKKMCNPFEE